MKTIIVKLLVVFSCLTGTTQVSFCQVPAKKSADTRHRSGLDSARVDSFYTSRGIRIPPNQNLHAQLYYEVYRWHGTRYCYGGNSQKGIDCSHFVNMLYEKVYQKKLEGSAADIYSQSKPLKGGIAKAEEGDLLFFKIKKKKISHVGIYLQNGLFAHASTQLGVIISSITEPYYKKHFYKARKIEWYTALPDVF